MNLSDNKVERKSFDLLQDNMESDHEIENDNDLEQAENPSKRRCKICKTIWITHKPSMNKPQRCTSINIVTPNPSQVVESEEQNQSRMRSCYFFHQNDRNNFSFYKQNYGA